MRQPVSPSVLAPSYVENLRYRHLYQPLAEFELELNPQHEAVMEAVLARNTERVLALSIYNYEQVTRFIEARVAAEVSTPKRRLRPPHTAGKLASSMPAER
jgi:hypothetical protein